MRSKKVIITLSILGVSVLALGGFIAYCFLYQPPSFLPQSVSSLFKKTSQMHISDLVPAAIMDQIHTESVGQPAAASAAEQDAAPATEAPKPLEALWATDPASGPVIHEPGVRRSLVAANKQSRLLRGEVKAVSPSHGVLVAMPQDIGGEGVISPDTLIADFHRRFGVGEKITVSVKGVSMKGSIKQLDLILVEP